MKTNMLVFMRVFILFSSFMRRVLYSTRKSQTLQSTFKLITEAKERTEKGLRLAEIEKESETTRKGGPILSLEL